MLPHLVSRFSAAEGKSPLLREGARAAGPVDGQMKALEIRDVSGDVERKI
jgi:hypothetical protein